LLTIDVDRGDRGHEPAAVNLVVDVLVAQRDRERSLLVAVDDGGDFAVATQCSGGPLTDRIARLGLELVGLAHGISFRFKTGVFPGWPENAKPAVLGTADPPRAASKGVCTGGGAITEADPRCNLSQASTRPERSSFIDGRKTVSRPIIGRNEQTE